MFRSSHMIALWAAVLLPALAPGCSAPPEGAAGAGSVPSTALASPGLRLAATLPPLAWLADRLTGAAGETPALLDGRTSPHVADSSPSAIRALETCSVWLAVGGDTIPAERAWMRFAAARTPAPTIIRVADGPLPHPWLDPEAMSRAAAALAAALEARGVPGTGERLRELQAEIDAVARDVRRQLAAGKTRFWVDHPAWGAFARSFGVEQIALERDGKEPGPAELAAAIRRARAEGVRSLIVARGARHPAAEVFAAETGAEIETLDPLAYDWPAQMRATARAVAGPR